jgi:hypothetical protein
MVEVGIAEYFSKGEALGIIGTMFVVLYFSRKHMQRLTVDVQTKVLNDDEWIGWLQWMRNCFKYGTIDDQWKQIQSERWINPDFEEFINKEMIPTIKISEPKLWYWL